MRNGGKKSLCGFVAIAVSYAREDATGKQDFERVCGACHKALMVSDLKTESEWIETVERMVSYGAKGTDDQFHSVMQYLSRNLTRVNVNAASAEEIASVLDVSKDKAQAVVTYRSRYGNLKSLDQLKRVSGLNATKLQARKKRIVFR